LDQIQEETKLSERERTVLLLAADGLTDKEIANNLGLSLKTVHTYWDRMRQKFDASTRTQVFAKFLRIEVAPGSTTARFHRLFATWEEGVWIVNATNGTIYANRRIAEMFGYTEPEFCALQVEEIFREAHAPDIGRFVRDQGGGARTLQTPISTRDGTRIWLQLTATPWSDERGRKKAVVLLVHNITLEKRVEHALKSCEVALDGIIDVSTDGICRFDGNLNCTDVNPSFLSAVGCSREAVVGKNVEKLGSYFEPLDLWVSSLRRALESGERQQFFNNESQPDRRSTWLFPEPSADFLPLSIIAVTRASN
jgi:PAS domain S-box-containing protein